MSRKNEGAPAFQREEHDEFLHAVAYDFYGMRLATAGADHQVKVWDQNPDTGAWKLMSTLRDHRGPCMCVAWAHPEIGQVLVSGSMDRSVCIYEEHETVLNGALRWHLRATLKECRGPVTTTQFSPRHMGLLLAVGSLDGTLRIYSNEDTVHLSSWKRITQFDFTLSWAEAARSSRTPVSGDDEDPTNNQMTYDMRVLVPGAPSTDARNRLVARHVAQASQCGRQSGVVCASWNGNRFANPLVAVGVGDCVKVLEYNSDTVPKWSVQAILKHQCDVCCTQKQTEEKREQSSPIIIPSSSEQGCTLVRDCAFAPNMGRSAQRLATGWSCGAVIVYELRKLSVRPCRQVTEVVPSFGTHAPQPGDSKTPESGKRVFVAAADVLYLADSVSGKAGSVEGKGDNQKAGEESPASTTNQDVPTSDGGSSSTNAPSSLGEKEEGYSSDNVENLVLNQGEQVRSVSENRSLLRAVDGSEDYEVVAKAVDEKGSLLAPCLLEVSCSSLPPRFGAVCQVRWNITGSMLVASYEKQCALVSWKLQLKSTGYKDGLQALESEFYDDEDEDTASNDEKTETTQTPGDVVNETLSSQYEWQGTILSLNSTQ